MKLTKNNLLKSLALALVLQTGFVAGDVVNRNDYFQPAVGTAYAAEEHNYWSTNVQTKQGVVTGQLDEKHNVVEWYGVPYAKAPLNDLRWKEPKQADKYATLDASKPGAVYIQPKGKATVGNEGALTLDIYRPNTNEKNLPVLVFLHGGNNQTSNSRLIMGQQFANEANAVYVSVQYRLGVLGFNNLPAAAKGNSKEKSGNYTLLDQQKALQWVKENIAAFGGNPKNVTVSGFSAGGRDVMAMLISPTFKGSFQKAISFSGGLTTADPAWSQKIIAKAIAPLAVESGMKENNEVAEQWLLEDTPEVRSFLYSLPAEKLAPLMNPAAIRMSVFPHLYADGKVLPKEGFDTTKFNNVPVLMLASAGEFTSFAARDKYFNASVKNKAVLNDPEIKKEYAFANKYGNAMYTFFNGQEAALKIADHYKAPIYVCNFAWGANPEVVGEEFATVTSAMHGIFMPFLSDQPYPFMKPVQAAFESKGTTAMRKDFIAYLGNFMRNGDPNGEQLAQWNKWSKDARWEMVLDATKEANVSQERISNVSYDQILKDIDADTTISANKKSDILANVLNGRWFSEGLDKKYNAGK